MASGENWRISIEMATAISMAAAGIMKWQRKISMAAAWLSWHESENESSGNNNNENGENGSSAKWHEISESSIMAKNNVSIWHRLRQAASMAAAMKTK